VTPTPEERAKAAALNCENVPYELDGPCTHCATQAIREAVEHERWSLLPGNHPSHITHMEYRKEAQKYYPDQAFDSHIGPEWFVADIIKRTRKAAFAELRCEGCDEAMFETTSDFYCATCAGKGGEIARTRQRKISGA